jgi:hypothetical protein
MFGMGKSKVKANKNSEMCQMSYELHIAQIHDTCYAYREALE